MEVEAMRDREHPNANVRHPVERLRLVVSLLAVVPVVVALLACGEGGALALTHAPASGSWGRSTCS